jgi:hypothetical protein
MSVNEVFWTIKEQYSGEKGEYIWKYVRKSLTPK